MKRIIIATLSIAALSTVISSPVLALSDRFDEERRQTLNKLNDRFDEERQQTLNKLNDRFEEERRETLDR